VKAIKQLIKKYGAHLLYQQQLQRQAYSALLDTTSKADGLPLSNASGNIFTYHGEDGIIQFIVKHLKNVPPLFVDIGSGDCIKSNCAVLAVHQNWGGVFIDADTKQLDVGKAFYKKLGKENLHFKQAYVSPQNCNELIGACGYSGPVGILSVDIDGNDFWIWKAIEIIKPSIVVVEAKVEFGYKSIAVPYSKENHRGFNKEYNGASVEAFRKLGVGKGYTLIGANLQGYNLFFIPDDLVAPPFYPAETKELLQFETTQQSFYPESFFQKHQFVSMDNL
jgi:hypothetical protein